jgi:ribose/xylose/arabinose/galactoside ABC-type transport system permease subunit
MSGLFIFAEAGKRLESLRHPAYLQDEKWSMAGRLVRAGLVFMSLVSLLITGSILTGGILGRPDNLLRMGMQSVPVIAAAAAMVFLFAQGGIDFSFMSAASLSCAIFAKLLQSGSPLPAAIAAGLAAAVFIGTLNGVIVGFVKVPGVIATLITGAIAQTTVSLILKGEFVRVQLDPDSIHVLMNVFGILSWVIALAAIALAILFSFVPLLTRKDSTDAPISYGAAGIRIGLPYLASSMIAGITGIFFALRINGATYSFGNYWIHEILFVLFFSGTVFGSRKGNPIGVLLAALYLAILNNTMSILGIDVFLQTLIIGISAIGSVFFNFGYEALVSYLFKKQKS